MRHALLLATLALLLLAVLGLAVVVGGAVPLAARRGESQLLAGARSSSPQPAADAPSSSSLNTGSPSATQTGTPSASGTGTPSSLITGTATVSAAETSTGTPSASNDAPSSVQPAADAPSLQQPAADVPSSPQRARDAKPSRDDAGAAAPAPPLPSALPLLGARRAHCGGVVPLLGTLNSAKPPFYFPDPALCPMPHVFSGGDLLRCLKARDGRVFFAGNSFARGMLFTLLRIATEDAAELPRGVNDRDAEKILCDKNSARGSVNESCVIMMDEGDSGASDAQRSASFLWRGSLWLPFDQMQNPSQAPGNSNDWCRLGSPAACWEAFFKGASQRGDVLISQTALGIAMAIERARKTITRDSVMILVAGMFGPFFASGVFKGTFVHVTAPRAKPGGVWDSYDRTLALTNDVIVAYLLENVTREHHVVIIDEAAFVAPPSTPADVGWYDMIHPPQQHYAAVLYLAFAAVCGFGA